MKIYIMTDLEGVAGIIKYDKRNIKDAYSFHERKKWGKYATAEVNAAIHGAFDANAEKVVVCDGHGMGDLLDLEMLDERAEIIIGNKRKEWLPFFDDTYDALILIGYHSMEGTKKGVLAHTYSHRAINKFFLNNKIIGEIGMCMAVAAWYKVPTIFISGDLKAVEEARNIHSQIESVVTKEGITNLCAKTIHINKSVKIIRIGVENAIKKMNSPTTCDIQAPYTLIVKYKNTLIWLYKVLKTQNLKHLLTYKKIKWYDAKDLPRLMRAFKII